MMMKQHILVPVDGSDHSLRALDFAITIAKETDDSILLLNVQPSYETPGTTKFFDKKEIESYRNEKGQEQLEAAKKKAEASGITFETKITIGSASNEINAEAKGARFIIMGSRGKGGIIGKVLGSVSYSVLHEAPCPVTVVK
jgi:nucleotide-binding universal stress UspA family protein